jgi:2-methylisocitrate lyase-like PEP mutase family enzyme
VLNARTDVYLLNKGATVAMFDETIARANAYYVAGARCRRYLHLDLAHL